jgi:predicted N-acetyltransferase YhbS
MVQVRALKEEDVAAADLTLRAAFGATRSFEPRLRRYWAVQPDGWMVAEDCGQIVGTAGAVDYGVIAYVGLMAVRPDRQRQRIGRQLLAAVLAGVDARGTPCALLDATDSGAALYRGAGFADAETSYDFVLPATRPAPSPIQAGDANVAIAGDESAVLPLDRELFGADRGRLWRRLFVEYGGRVLIAREAGGAVAGYLCAQEMAIGPWAARTPAAAAALLDAAAARFLTGVPVRIAVPGENAAARALLAARGAALQRTLRHMRRGPAPALPGWRLLYGKGSYCVG